jgi:hypothetical protein
MGKSLMKNWFANFLYIFRKKKSKNPYQPLDDSSSKLLSKSPTIHLKSMQQLCSLFHDLGIITSPAAASLLLPPIRLSCSVRVRGHTAGGGSGQPLFSPAASAAAAE